MSDTVRLHIDPEERFTDETLASLTDDNTTTTTSQDEEDDEVVEVDPSEVAWQNFQAMVPNCFGKSKITLETPPLELLPYRSWPAKMRYTLSIDKIASSNRPTTTTGLVLGMAACKFSY